jgi:hypothetical protein
MLPGIEERHEANTQNAEDLPRTFQEGSKKFPRNSKKKKTVLET